MRAILSGQAGLALLGEGDTVWAVAVETPDERTPCNWRDAPYLLADAHDIVELQDVSQAKALEELEQAWRRDRALQLLLILLDREEEAETRTMAAECVDEHFASDSIRDHTADRLYSAPLPSSADPARAKQLACDANAQRVVAFLAQLAQDQTLISRTRRAWNEIDADTFATDGERARFEAVAVGSGAFRIVAEAVAAGTVEQAWMRCLSDSQIKSVPGYRNVITAWINPLRPSPTEIQDDGESGTPHQSKRDRKGNRKSRRGSKPAKEPTVHERWTRFEKEIATILADIDNGRETRALKYTQELVERQKSEDNEEFAVKTLCNLAKQMKDRKLHQLQLQFAQWASDEFSWDAQAQTQLADAYLSLGCLDDALAQYEETIQRFPNNEVAGCGRAEVLRGLGRLDAALTQYEETIQRFPNDAVAGNGRAEVLCELGRLDDALGQYEEMIQRFPNNEVAGNGRAEVLRELGRLDDALAQYEETIQRFPDNVVAGCGRAEVLRELGRLDDALAQYEETIQRFPNNEVAGNGRAEVLRELGRLDDALAQYEETIQRFPNNTVAVNGLAELLRELARPHAALTQYEQTIQRFPNNAVAGCGRAEVLRELGRLDDALAEYEEMETRFPTSRVVRNAKANILIEMRRYDEALLLLPERPPRARSDWIDLHVRGMAHLHRGDYEVAISVFQQGLRDCPFFASAAYFRTALAVAQLRQRKYADAVSTLADQPGDVADVLRLHAHAEQGHSEDARAAHQRLQNSRRPRVIQLRDELAAAFLVDETSAVSRTVEWYDRIHAKECELVAHRIAA